MLFQMHMFCTVLYGNCPIHGGVLACNTRNDTQHFLLFKKITEETLENGKKTTNYISRDD